MNIVGYLFEQTSSYSDIMDNGITWGMTDLRPLIAVTAVQIIFALVLIWGIACVLLLGKRLITNKAGRSRTSFKLVRMEGRKFVINLFLTGILRDCFTILWGLLLIVPGVIYAIRTAFYHVTIVCEGLGYRSALKQSKEVVTGHTWTALWYLFGLGVVLFFPAILLTGLLDQITIFDPRLMPAIFLLESVAMSLAILIFNLATILLYSELKKLPHPVEVKPDTTQ
jgi:hypothetical protein